MDSNRIRLLLIEDNPGDARLIREALRESGGEHFDLQHADRLATGLARLAEGDIRLVLLDLSLPDSHGLDTVARTRAHAPDVPIVVLTGLDDEALALKALEIGVQDYLVKGGVGGRVLSRAIRYAIERQGAEQALRESEQRFRSLFENMLDGFAYCQMLFDDQDRPLDFVYLAVNGAFERLTGLENVVGKHVTEVIPGIKESNPELFEIYGRVALTGRPERFETYLEFLGSWFSIAAYSPGKGYFIAVFDNSTERKTAEEALKTSEAKYRRLFEAAKDGILILNADTGEVKDVNPFLIEMLGYSHTEFLGKQLWEIGLFKDIVANKSAFRQLQEKKYIRYENLPLQTKDARRIFVEFVSNVYEVNGKQIIQCNIRDITKRRQADKALAEKNEEIKAMTQQLWHAARLATMGELAASIAHELNNPLGTVSLRVESLLSQMPLGDPGRRELEVVEQEAERMGALVAHLLQFSRRGAPQISTVDVREETGNTLELIHYHLRQRQITVQREFASDVTMVQADRQQLRQLFLNLFTNAADAMPEGGALTIRVSDHPAQHRVLIEVADTGTGIAPEDLPRVMEPFFTTKPEGKGTGLGLAICRRIVQEHNGTFEISSAGPGQGTTVRLTLPGQNDTHEVFLSEA